MFRCQAGSVHIYLEIKNCWLKQVCRVPQQPQSCVCDQIVYSIIRFFIFQFTLQLFIQWYGNTMRTSASWERGTADGEYLPHIPPSFVCILRSTVKQISMGSFFFLSLDFFVSSFTSSNNWIPFDADKVSAPHSNDEPLWLNACTSLHIFGMIN